MNVSTGSRTTLRAALVSLVCGIALMPGPGYAAPDDKSIEAVRAELDSLYRTAEVATEAYNAATEKAAGQQKRLSSLRQDLARSEQRVADLRDLAGAAARMQYRGGDLAATGLQLLLGDHPDQALDEAAQAGQVLRNLVNVSEDQRTARAELDRRTEAATAELRKLESTRADKAEAKKKIEGKIDEAERIEAGLEQEEQSRLAQLEAAAEQQAESQWPKVATSTGGTPATTSGGGGGRSGGTVASGAAAQAVAFAKAQIGKPYVWGAVGPSSYDCSGLTSAAWAAAGHPIPRTSQAQWQGLTRVSLATARPGDLIIYYSDATHVGMYTGGGQMVHAPRPGRTVTIAPVASMPILGVVRPGV